MTDKAIKNGTACLVIVAEDASDNTKKMFTNSCDWYEVDLAVYGTKEELGHAIGKEIRASVAVTDMGFAESLMKQLGTVNTDMEVN